MGEVRRKAGRRKTGDDRPLRNEIIIRNVIRNEIFANFQRLARMCGLDLNLVA
jgi:hypothetical protein